MKDLERLTSAKRRTLLLWMKSGVVQRSDVGEYRGRSVNMYSFPALVAFEALARLRAVGVGTAHSVELLQAIQDRRDIHDAARARVALDLGEISARLEISGGCGACISIPLAGIVRDLLERGA